MLSSFPYEKKSEPTVKISHSFLFVFFLVSSSWRGLYSTPRRPGVERGRFGFASVPGGPGATVTDVQLLTSAARERIFAESRERWMYFQVHLWCSIVRLMNGTDISTKKKKNDRKSVLLQSKKHIHQSHTPAGSQGELTPLTCLASALIQVPPAG